MIIIIRDAGRVCKIDSTRDAPFFLKKAGVGWSVCFAESSVSKGILRLICIGLSAYLRGVSRRSGRARPGDASNFLLGGKSSCGNLPQKGYFILTKRDWIG